MALVTPYTLKASLRKSMLRTLKSMSEADIEAQSIQVAQILFKEKFFREAKSIGCYLSMGKGELRTNHIVSDILQRGIRLFTPYIPEGENSEMRMLRLHSTADLEACPLDKWGILDPSPTRRDANGEAREDAMDWGIQPLDLILIPGVAFDRDCNRIGASVYLYRSELTPFAVALALSPQILRADSVPTTELDFRLDGIVSPEGIIWREGVQE
ncbi:5-formyltetrahydrofolate cyclo-ligase, partial [Tremellales sp. Uapishka_1]